MAAQKLLLLVFLQLLVILQFTNLANAGGLQLGFYRETCPDAELIVHQIVYKYIYNDRALAASLLRMHFHDCFVRGCDGSVLLSSPNKNAEKDAFPNLSLRGFDVIDAVKSALEQKCPGVVSCADILTLVARDAVLMIGGPFWEVPTGRKDGRVSIASEVSKELPSPFSNIDELKQFFASKGLTPRDLVVLSGAHTIGIGHCGAFANRLYNFTGRGDADPSLDPNYAIYLKKLCKPGDLNAIVEMDPGSSRTFDEDYYKVVATRRGLFQSDAALLDDVETKGYVKLQALTNGISFTKDFAESMVKMGKIGVLTDQQGEIRKNCAFVN